MSHTKKIVINAYLIGFIISTSLLFATIPLLDLLLVPFIFYYTIHFRFKSNITLIVIFISIQLLISSHSLFVFVFTVYENSLLFFYVLVINLFKPICHNLTLFLFAYFFITTNLLTLIFVVAVLSSLGLHIPPSSIVSSILTKYGIFILIFIMVYAVNLLVISSKINFCIDRIEKHFKAILTFRSRH